MKESHQKWVEEALKTNQLKRQSYWTESVAVGDKAFLESVQDKLKYRVKGRNIVDGDGGVYQIREIQKPYGETESKLLFDIRFFWE